MELIEVAAFIAIADAGGFSRAAVALRISQPAISRRIELLERELGAPLFARTRAGATLTDAGRAFRPHAQRLLAAARDGADAVRALTAAPCGELTLALVGTLARADLAARLRAFRVAQPTVRLRLRTARSDEVSALVRQADAHLGLRYFTAPEPDLASQQIGVEPLLLVAAPDSRIIPTDPATPADFRGAPWVGFAAPAAEPYVRLLARQLARHGLDDADVIAIDSLTAQKRLIEADFGLGLLPASAVEEELRVGTLRRLPLPELEASIPIVAVWRASAPLTPAASLLLEALTAHAPGAE
jgi:DNA-binding transcriptional LysR family regulator